MRVSHRLSAALLVLASGCLTKPAPPPGPEDICVPGGATEDHCSATGAIPPKIQINGAIYDNAGTPLAGVTVQTEPGNGIDRTHDAPAAGAFAIDLDPRGAPLRACARITAPGFPVHERHALRPLTTATVDWSTKLLSDADLASLYTGSSLAFDPSRATVMVVISDCNTVRVAGTTVTSTPPPRAIAYFGGGTSTDATGVAFLLGVAPGDTEIRAGGGADAYQLAVRAGEVLVVELTQ